MRLKTLISAFAVSAVLLGGIARAGSDHGRGHGPGGPHGDDPVNGDGSGHGGGHAGEDPGTRHGGNGNGGTHGHGAGHGGRTCDPVAVAAAETAVDAACPCEGPTATTAWKNHGQYVRCIAHATKDLIRASSGSLSRRCMRGSVACGARSTCGKQDAVACRTVTTDTCVNAVCSNDPEHDCTTDADCTHESCKITTAAHCGGIVGTGTCCAAGSPSGAFIDQMACD